MHPAASTLKPADVEDEQWSVPYVGDEAELIANVQPVVGPEPIVGAGVFGLQDLVLPWVAGGTAGGVLAGEAAGAMAGVAGVLLGQLAAKHAAAKRAGVTLKLVVAVTATKIHVINWGDASDTTRIVKTFDRSTTTADVRKFGLSRIVTLHDTATDTEMRLHASVARWTSQSGPDKDVLAELSRAAA